jgi:hypothetical protein
MVHAQFKKNFLLEILSLTLEFTVSSLFTKVGDNSVITEAVMSRACKKLDYI